MKKIIIILCAVSLIIGISGSAGAITIVDLLGDKDGFGIGVEPDEWFYYGDVTAEVDDPLFTDRWVFGDQSWTHTYDISGIDFITSASIELLTGGQGWQGTSSLYIDDQYVGELTAGDSPGNYARLDTFDLMAFSSYLNGADSIRVDTQLSGDGWVLDYSELTISGNPVPEPATMLLLGSGIIGLAGFRRKIRNRRR